MENYQIPKLMNRLEKNYKDYGSVDVCLATNMISVGLDVQRLGLMCCITQPKSTAEYIQATSRIGRNSKKPGLIFTVYNTARARDMSHFEQFKSYHSKIYSKVEAVSLTPYSIRVRDRALAAIFIAYIRNHINQEFRYNAEALEMINNEIIINNFKEMIKERIKFVDQNEIEDTMNEIDKIISDWKKIQPSILFDWFPDFTGKSPLFIQQNQEPHPSWKPEPFKVPTSMRNIDKESVIKIKGLE